MIRIAIIVWACMAIQGASIWAQTATEYQIKAAFLYNFIKFVQWPPESFPDEDQPFVIGILGDDPFGPILDRVVQGKLVNGRKLVVWRSDTLTQLRGAHLVFISRSERGRLRQVLRELAGKPILTVSEIDGFARLGGMINFRMQGDRVRFEINPEAVRAAGLKMSSKLLSLATIVSAQSLED